MSLATGERLGPYTIVAALGAGGMGEVYRARDDRLGRDVAVKILPPQMKSDPDRLRRFALEARAAGALDHPNIIAVHDFNAEAEHPYIVTELLEGTTLRQHLRAVPLPARKALGFAVQIARALAAAHDKGIVHRDLKPENLFVLEDGRIKILDFGLAKAAGSNGENESTGGTISATDHTSTGAILGSAGYMSPEQVQGRPADHRSDLFSFGAVIYEMLAGRRAFEGATPVERAYAILKDHPPALRPVNAEVSPVLERVIQRCLEKSPGERFQSAHDLAFELELALEHLGANTRELVASPLLPLDAPGATGEVTPAPMRPPARRPTAAIAWVLSVAAAFAGGAALMRAGTPSPPAASEAPRYQRVTFRREWIGNARFAPDGRSVVYSAALDQEVRVYESQLGSPEERAISAPKSILFDVSARGEMALGLHQAGKSMGLTLARAPLSGGTPRPLIDRVIGADYSADGTTLAVARKGEGNTRLEFPIGKVLLELEGTIFAPRVSPDGRSIAFLHWPIPDDDRGTVDIVDLEGNRKTLSGPWLSINALAWARDGTEILFSASKESTYRSIYAVTPDGVQREVLQTAGSIAIEDVAADGRILIARISRGASIIAGRPGERQRDLSWFDHSMPVDLTADGRRLLFIESGEASPTEMTTYWRDLDGSPAVRLATGKALAISPNGEWALIAPRPPDAELHLVPTGAGLEKTLPTGPVATYQTARFLPDGKTFAVGATTRDGRARVLIQDVDGSPPRELTPPGFHLVGRPSPDGRWLLVRDHSRKLYRVEIASGELAPVEGFPTDRDPVKWTDDGEALLAIKHAYEFPVVVVRFDLETAEEIVEQTIDAPDSTGLPMCSLFMIAQESDAYTYALVSPPSELYVVDRVL